MVATGGGLLMSQAQLKEKASAKWRTVRLFLLISAGMIFSIPIALLPFAVRRVQPTAEFVFLVVVPGIWNSLHGWISLPCLYVVLNLVIVTLGFKSGALSSTHGETETCSYTLIKLASDQNSETKAYYSQCNITANYELMAAPATGIQKLQAALVPEYSSPAPKESNPAASALYCRRSSSSSLRRSATTLYNFSRECSGQNPESGASESAPAENCEECPSAPPLVVFEISVEQIVDDQTEDQEEPDLSADELYVKAENFIGNFKRQLKMQREDSWKRLQGIYKQSC